MKPKVRYGFKKFIRKLEGKDEGKVTGLLPNGFYVGERVYYLDFMGNKNWGVVTDLIPQPGLDVIHMLPKDDIVWCFFDRGAHWFNYVRDTFHDEDLRSVSDGVVYDEN